MLAMLLSSGTLAHTFDVMLLTITIANVKARAKRVILRWKAGPSEASHQVVGPSEASHTTTAIGILASLGNDTCIS